jgi:putative transposase
MIEPSNQQLSVSRQCEVMDISRSSYYYQPKPISHEDLELMRKIDELYLHNPSSGSRTISRQLGRQGITANRKRVQRLMRLMGIEAVYPKPRTSRPHPQHKIYPYLLKGLTINRTNQVWATDITFSAPRLGICRGAYPWNARKCLAIRCGIA